ncbi:microtubule-associated protein 10-like [Corticium candelabrum]|uniref:microtubule-associated protein 10-like n=1 Tax=Corticium candelabrum TaxID=121492 RepID=UPI002E25B2E3|nr:microtubule-associated protein 10-like [Corticium candelabrum]
MPADEKSSLFSIELVVDSVGSVEVPCRLPVVAFRLLDLPTVVIHSASLQQVESLRQKMKLGSSHTRLQLLDIQDHHGNFMFGKGKSCLFKMNFNVLCRHLHATPLYLMLLDVWSSPAHLIGSTSIRLDAVADDLMKYREDNGDSSPGVSGGRGKFPVFNLMGSRVATVDVGYRMYSLGPALATHLQVARDERGTISETGEATSPTRERGMHAVSVQVDDKMVGCAIPADEVTDVEQGIKRHSSGRTNKSQRLEQLHANHTTNGKVEEQVYIMNTVCPPPLFYNSEAANVAPPSQHDTESIENSDEDTINCSDSPVDESQVSYAESGIEEDHWRNVVASEPNNFPLQATSMQRVAQEVNTDLLSNSEIDERGSHDDRNQEEIAPPSGHSQFSLLFGLLYELSQLLGNQDIPARTQRQTTSQAENSQIRGQTQSNLHELASVVYQHLAIQHRTQGLSEARSLMRKKKTAAAVNKQPHSLVDTRTKGLCPRAFATSSPPQPYRNLSYFARFPKKPNSTPHARTEIPFSKPRHRHSEMITKHQGGRKRESLKSKKKSDNNVKKLQASQPHENTMSKTESEGELSENISKGSGSVHQNANSIQVHLPDVTCDDDIVTEGLPDAQDNDENTVQLGEKLDILSHTEQQHFAASAAHEENQLLRVEDLKIHSLSLLSASEQSQQQQQPQQQLGSKERSQESDEQSDVYSEQFEDESHNTSVASSHFSHSTSQSKTASSKRSSRNSQHRTNSSRSSSSSSSSSTRNSRSSRDSAMPRIASMTNLKAIESNLGYTI